MVKFGDFVVDLMLGWLTLVELIEFVVDFIDCGADFSASFAIFDNLENECGTMN